MQLAAVSHLAFQDCDQKDLMSNDQMKQQLQYCKDIVGLVLRALSLAGSCISVGSNSATCCRSQD